METIELPHLARHAEVRARSFDAEALTVEVVWTTGARVRRRSWTDGPYDEELSVNPNHVRLDRLNQGAPFLNTHDSWDLAGVIGSVVPGSARIDTGRGLATVQLSRRPEIEGIVQDIRDGVIRNVSVGYRVHKVEKTEGQDGDPPLWRVVDWEPMELSAVPVPADPGARVRSGCESRRGEELFPCVVIRADAPAAPAASQEEIATMSVAPRAAENEGGRTHSESAPAVAPETRAPELAAPPSPPALDPEAIRAAERQRVADITALIDRHGLERGFADQHVRSGASIEQVRIAVLDALAERADRHPVTSRVEVVGRSEEERRAAAIETALLHRFDPRTFSLTDQAREFRGMSLLEIARDCLEARGVRTRGMSRSDLAYHALTVRAGGMMTTSDFPNVLANVANKTLRMGYEAAGQTFRPLVRVVFVPDFKTVSRVQLGDAPQLEKVNEHGEFKRGKMAEGAESYKVSTYGKVVAITRQVIVNDDLDAVTRIPRAFGVQAANLESDLVWGEITSNPTMGDGIALFHASHGNLAGSGGAISVDTVGAGRAAMRLQKGVDGKTLINVVPAHLVVPTALQTKVEQFLGQIYAAKPADAVPTSMRSLVPIAEPRLDAASATAWYLAADPAQIDLIELAYLEGGEGVYTETRTGFDVDGVEVKVRQDVGAKVLDHRGLYKNTGA